jgi:hypothetical protein
LVSPEGTRFCTATKIYLQASDLKLAKKIRGKFELSLFQQITEFKLPGGRCNLKITKRFSRQIQCPVSWSTASTYFMVKSHDKISNLVTDRSNLGGTESLLNFNDVNNWELHGVRLFLRAIVAARNRRRKINRRKLAKILSSKSIVFFWAVHKVIIIVICLYQDNNIQLRI